MPISKQHRTEEAEPGKLYQVSSIEIVSLLCYTACALMYIFCVALICRRIFLTRPALQEAHRELAVASYAPPQKESEKS